MKILVIIPAKMDSKRLHEKNIQLLNDRPLIEYTIDFAKQSKYKPSIYLSSESTVIRHLATKNKVGFIGRGPEMIGDTEIVDVYIETVEWLQDVDPTLTWDLVVGLQPDNPDRDYPLDHYIGYMIDNNYDDLFTVNPQYKRSGSVRIFKYKDLIEKKISKRVGCLLDGATDIHTRDDLKQVEKKFK